VAEISSVGGCGTSGVPFLREISGTSPQVRGSIVMVERTGGMPANVAIHFSLLLIDTVK
jgi:hypothetical protein